MAEPVSTKATASKRPRPKVAAVGVGGSAVTVLIALADAMDWDLTPAVAAAIATIATFAAGYWKGEG